MERSTSAAVVICARLVETITPYCPSAGQPPDGHLQHRADLHDLIERAVLKQFLPQLDGDVGVNVIAEIPPNAPVLSCKRQGYMLS